MKEWRLTEDVLLGMTAGRGVTSVEGGLATPPRLLRHDFVSSKPNMILHLSTLSGKVYWLMIKPGLDGMEPKTFSSHNLPRRNVLSQEIGTKVHWYHLVKTTGTNSGQTSKIQSCACRHDIQPLIPCYSQVKLDRP